MCELTHEYGDFYREVFAKHAAPLKFCGLTLYRTRAEQAEVDAQAKRIADLSVRELRSAIATDQSIFEAFEHVSFDIELRNPHLLHALADAYRDKDHAELGRIVASRMDARLRYKAEDTAECEVNP